MNFSLGEIIVVLLIALLVIRPEELPQVAYKMGQFAQSIRRFFTSIKNEVNSFVETAEKPGNKREK